MKFSLFICVSVFCMQLFFACATARAEGPYVFSVNPWGEAEEMKNMYRPMIEYFKEQTGEDFEIVIFPTYEAMMDEIEMGNIHFASLNAVGYMKLRKRGVPMQYLATAIRSFGEFERESYYGYIIALKDAPYENLEDLRGTVFGFVEKNSGSGYKMPLALLGLKGETPESFFKKYFYLGDHDQVCRAVYYGSVDAGATWEASYIINNEKFHDAFKIVHQTPPIPNDAWIAGAGVPEELVNQIRDLLLDVDTYTTNENGDYVLDDSLGSTEIGFVLKDPEFYDQAAPLLLYQE